MIEKSFINYQLGIKFNSYIDHKFRVWFKAKEVATILGQQDTNQAIRKHVSENHKRKFILSQPVDSTGQVIKDKKSQPVDSTGQVIKDKKSQPVDSTGQVIKDKKSLPVDSTGQVIKDKKSLPVDLTGQSQGRWIIFVDEPGFYELVFKSRLQTAKMFREWVFAKVLPSIRKYGYYKMIDYRIKQRVIFEGEKYYKHQVFYNYAANGDKMVIF